MKESRRMIDIHAHIYPEQIADKASDAIGEFYRVRMACRGTVEGLLTQPEKMTYYVVHSVATKPHQVASINQFIYEQTLGHPNFIGFATLHPDMENIDEEIERVIGLGLKGIKLHPDFQRFNIDDEKAVAMYRSFAGRLPVLIHMGDDRTDFSHPTRLARVLDRIPELTVIAAHMGGYRQWDAAKACLIGREGLYIDSSSSLFAISAEEATAIIRAHGVHQVLFGSDYPMWTYHDELERVRHLGLSEEEFDDYFYNNAAKLLGV